MTASTSMAPSWRATVAGRVSKTVGRERAVGSIAFRSHGADGVGRRAGECCDGKQPTRLLASTAPAAGHAERWGGGLVEVAGRNRSRPFGELPPFGLRGDRRLHDRRPPPVLPHQ